MSKLNEKYIFFILGIVFGVATVLYIWMNREEKIENIIKNNQKIFSTEKLDETMETIVWKMKKDISHFKRTLTEEEKNKIIEQCLKESFTDK